MFKIALVKNLKNFTEKVKVKNALFMAHNLSGYDAYFVIQGFTDEGICPVITLRGGKVLALDIPGNKLKFIDSYSQQVFIFSKSFFFGVSMLLA